MNGKPNSKQKKFHEWCRGQSCIVSGRNCDAIHHIKGARMKLKSVCNAGEWLVIPISYWWHQDGNNENAIHVNRSNFVKTLGLTEKDWWIELIKDYEREFGRKPMSEMEYHIIVGRA